MEVVEAEYVTIWELAVTVTGPLYPEHTLMILLDVCVGTGEPLTRDGERIASVAARVEPMIWKRCHILKVVIEMIASSICAS